MSFFFFSSRRRHTRCLSDWSSDVCSSDLASFALVASGWTEQLPQGVDRIDAPTPHVWIIGRTPQVADGRWNPPEIGRASCRKECRSRWSRYHYKKKRRAKREVRESVEHED